MRSRGPGTSRETSIMNSMIEFSAGQCFSRGYEICFQLTFSKGSLHEKQEAINHLLSYIVLHQKNALKQQFAYRNFENRLKHILA